MSKVIFSGLESCGKSLKLAMLAEKILFRNADWLKKSGIVRPIAFNFPLSLNFKKKAEELKIPLIFWDSLDDLIKLRDCDIFIDEVGTYFDSRFWQDLSLDVRRWVQQGAKMGIELYGACQDFAQVDISFRRLTNELYLIKKVIGSDRPANTKPPIKNIWGLCFMFELDPQNYSEDKKKFLSNSIIPKIFFITRYYCELFDTKYFIKKTKEANLIHIERKCLVCGISKISHK